MTAKKAIKKSIVSPIFKPPYEEYKEVFPEIEIITTQKIDLNWVSVRRKIQQFNFLINAERKKTIKEKYDFDLWEIYCLWFNQIFNKKIVVNDDEDYNKIEQQIRGKKYE